MVEGIQIRGTVLVSIIYHSVYLLVLLVGICMYQFRGRKLQLVTGQGSLSCLESVDDCFVLPGHYYCCLVLPSSGPITYLAYYHYYHYYYYSSHRDWPVRKRLRIGEPRQCCAN